jgi:hypothetical protein
MTLFDWPIPPPSDQPLGSPNISIIIFSFEVSIEVTRRDLPGKGYVIKCDVIGNTLKAY